MTITTNTEAPTIHEPQDYGMLCATCGTRIVYGCNTDGVVDLTPCVSEWFHMDPAQQGLHDPVPVFDQHVITLYADWLCVRDAEVTAAKREIAELTELTETLQANLTNSQERVFNAQNALARFKEQVVRATVAFDGGCRSGKTEFLNSLDLEWPETTYKIEFTVTTSDEEADVESWAENLCYYDGGSISGVYVCED